MSYLLNGLRIEQNHIWRTAVLRVGRTSDHVQIFHCNNVVFSLLGHGLNDTWALVASTVVSIALAPRSRDISIHRRTLWMKTMFVSRLFQFWWLGSWTVCVEMCGTKRSILNNSIYIVHGKNRRQTLLYITRHIIFHSFIYTK